MTPFSTFRRIRGPLASAFATALVFTVALWLQHVRSGWPFAPADAAAAGIGDGIAGIEAMTSQGRPESGRATTGVDPNDRSAVDAEAARSLDIRLETVGRQSLTESVRAVATIVPDESRISHVHTRVAGWVEQLDVNTTGEIVRTGQPLARLFSQELLSSQTEYLSARRGIAASGITSAVVASGRTRLAVLGMTAGEIEAIEQSGQPKRLVTVVAPRSGVVVNRGVTVGTSVDPSTTLLTIADLSRVWVLAEIPEAHILKVRVGSVAQLDFAASGRPPFTARVDFVYPTLTERTRTLRVRLSAANTGGTLRPGLYGTATFQSTGQDVITVPREAVVDTGLQQHVFVANGDRYEPRPVTVGVQLADRVEIRAGLQAGEQIVAAGVFLLDSESRVRATGGMGGHSHGTAPDRDAAPPPAVTDPHGAHKPSSLQLSAPAAGPHAGHRPASANTSAGKE
jgi:membrane fusion protein, copper/silver efflux system